MTSKITFLIISVMILMAGSAITGCGKTDAIQKLDQGSLALAPDTMTVLIKGYRAQAGSTLQNLFVSNFSVRVSHGQLFYSTARDGMDDTLKKTLATNFGFSIASPESVVTGFADLLVFNMGVKTSQQPLIFCSGSQMTNTSGDGFLYDDRRVGGKNGTFLGIRDCEKVQLGLKPKLFDSAGNGIPDYMKLRCGINPTNKNSAFVSTASDGVANIDKCKRHIPLDENAATQPNQLYAYQYSTQQNGDGSTDFTVANIPILNGGDQNFLAFYITETGLSSTAPGIYSAYAIVKAGYAGKKLTVPYWALDASKPNSFVNQVVTVP